MELDEAIKILEKHNEWRRYNGDIDKSPAQTNPKKLGLAIDAVIFYYRLNKAIEKAKPNMDKIKDLEEFLKETRDIYEQ